MSIRPTIGQHLLAIGLMFGSHLATAAPTETQSPSTPEQLVTAPALWLEVVNGPSDLDPEAVRVAIETELGIPTTRQPSGATLGRVHVEGTASESVIVRFESADGTTRLERSVAMPINATRRATVIAWITGNLVRNEAAELLSSMKGRQKPDEAGALPASVPEIHAEASVASAPDAATPNGTVPTLDAPPHSVKAIPTNPVRVTFAVATDAHPEPDLGPSRLVHAALVSPWLAMHSDANRHRYYVSFGGFYSHIGALGGLGLGLLVDRIEHRSSGLQLSGLWIDGATHRGVLIAGLGTSAKGDLYGTEVSGATTLRSGNVDGVQLTGVLAYSSSDVRGAQVAGATSIARGNLSGFQLSTGFNYLGSDVVGAQITGGLNVARDVRGLQLGVVNVGRDVDGLQLGVVNVARQNRGLSLGLFNWSDGARLQPTYFYQTPGYHNVGYRNLSGHATSSISFGYDEPKQYARTHFAVGVHTTFNRVAMGVETGYGWVLEHLRSGPTDRAHELDLIGTVTVEIIPKLVSLYGGGGVALPVAGVVPVEPRGLGQAGISFL
jgi:hypothetical protein